MRHARLLLLVLPLLAACGPDDPLADELLAGADARTWALGFRATDGVEDFLNPCEASLQVTFRADASWVSRQTGDECVPDDRAGGWDINNVGDKLTLTEGGDSTRYRILELTEETLRIVTLERDPEVEERYEALP
jgi:hypothetical protein